MAKVIRQDDNNHLIQGWFSFMAEKEVAFDGSTGNGEVGEIDLFDVTGDILYLMVAKCSESLAGATATLQFGLDGDTDALMSALLATNIDAGDFWLKEAGAFHSSVEMPSQGSQYQDMLVSAGVDIKAEVATADITDGTIKFYLWWYPLSSNADVESA